MKLCDGFNEGGLRDENKKKKHNWNNADHMTRQWEQVDIDLINAAVLQLKYGTQPNIVESSSN